MRNEKKKLKNSLFIILISLFLAFIFRFFFFEAFYMPSDSMKPTLESGDVLFAQKKSFFNNDRSISYGDIVIFKFSDEARTYIKRVVGLPKDIIEVRNGVLFLNQIPQTHLKNNESECTEETLPNAKFYTICLTKPQLSITEKITIKEDEYFVMSDQRVVPPNTKKIRVFGLIKKSDIIAQSSFIWISFDPSKEGIKKFRFNRFLKPIP